MGALVLATALPALAVDHNNVDAHRPLTFDDAEAIAYREQALEFGLGLGWPKGSPVGLKLEVEHCLRLCAQLALELWLRAVHRRPRRRGEHRL